MGVVLDTSYLIDAEHKGLRVAGMLAAIPGDGAQSVAICAVSLTELVHGASIAKSKRSAAIREEFLTDLRDSVPVIAVDDEVAVRAGRIGGALQKTGITIGIADGLIAATALELGYSVLTLNGKHFKPIAGLDVVEL